MASAAPPAGGAAPASKRPAPGGDAAGQAAKQRRTPEVYVVYTTSHDAQKGAIKTVVGDYVERGISHERKVYQKVQDRDRKGFVDVLIYYWDGRGGDESSEGWWIGNKLGGSQVWAHCKASGPGETPPEQGWRVPWDGDVCKTLRVANKKAKAKADAEASFHRLSRETARLEYEVDQGVERARAAAAGEEGAPTSAEALAAAAADLEKNLAAVAGVLEKALAAAAADLSEPIKDLVSRLEAVAGSAPQALEALQAAREAAEDEERQRETEGPDSQVVEAILLEASELASSAEEMVEKAEITYDMVSSCGDDEDSIRQAVHDTTASAGEAQAARTRARAFLDAKLPICKQLENRAAKERAFREISRLRQLLAAGQTRLEPLRSVRQDWERRCRAQRAASEADEKLASAEAEADKAEAAVALVKDGTCTREALAGALSQLRAAEEQVESAIRFVGAKGMDAEGLEELPDLQQRGVAARDRLRGLRAAVAEAKERETARGQLEEVSSRVASVTKSLNELEGRYHFLEAGATDVGPCEAASAGVKSALRMARSCLQMKLIEVRRFSEVVAAEATAELKSMQQRLEEPSARLSELLNTISRQRLEGVAKDAEAPVVGVEGLVAALREAASLLADSPAAEAMTAEELRQAVARVTDRERKATEALLEARRFVASKQLEARSRIGEAEAQSEASAVFTKLQARLADGQAEIARHRRLPGSIDRQLASRKVVADAEEQLASAVEKVSKAAAAAARFLGAEDGSAELQREAEKPVQEAQIALRTVSRLIVNLSRLEGGARAALAQLETAARGAQERADGLGVQLKERAESTLCRSLLQEAARGVEVCEAAAEQAALAEEPLAAGLDSLTTEQASDAIANLERAVQAAQTQLLTTRTLVSMKRVATRRFSEAARGAASEELDRLQGRTEAASQRLAELRSRTAELKRSSIRKEALAR